MKRLLHSTPVSLSRLMLTTLMVVLILLSWGSLLAYHVCPRHTVFFQWLGLIVPIFIGINLLFLILGLFRSRLLFISAAIALIGCAHYVPKVIQFPKKASDLTADLRVATFNVRGFRMDYNLPSVALIAAFVDAHQIDAICLQEIPADYAASTLQSAFPDMPHQVLTSGEKGQHKLAILSKYPILYSETISFPERAQCALIADLQAHGQPLRLFNYHLQTTNWNQIQGFTDLLFPSSYSGHPTNTLSRNFIYRGNQALQLSKIVSESTYPTVLCGDMNDSPVSYVYHTMLGNMKDAFREAGQGYGYTYRYFMKLFRIDYVFFSEQHLRALTYRTLSLPYSDHLPVIVDFKLKEKDI